LGSIGHPEPKIRRTFHTALTGFASCATIDEGGFVNLNGGTAYNVVVSGITSSSGGSLNVGSGGTASGTTVVEEGLELVEAGGLAISTVVVGSSAFDNSGALSRSAAARRAERRHHHSAWPAAASPRRPGS
jgi:autotransporter passenger strand-loop-strand repeat protein